MELRILGPLEVRTEEGVVSLPRRRERVLLAALSLRPGVVVSADQLVEAIWGETPPRTATGSLQNAVSELRKALGHEALQTRPPGYVLAVEPDAIDARRFERVVREAAAQEPAERAETLASALALWRGPALADLADEPFARNEAARLDELRLAAVEDRLDADLTLGRGADLVAEIEAHVAANPLRERLRGHLMLSLYRAGRQAEALEAYQDARRALVDELGIDPSPALQELERRVLRQDPELLAAETTSPGPTPAAAATVTRKTVTVLAAALDGVAGLDPEALRPFVDRFLAAVHETTGRHGGTLDRFLGAEAVAVFGVPVAHEDDALRAARAAVELREALSAAGIASSAGIATGDALVGDGEAPIVGDVVPVATALRDAAGPNEILVGPVTEALLGDAVEVGDERRVGARALAARPLHAVQGARAPDVPGAPLVGREAQLDAIREALARATSERRCVAVTILGDAGIGKTRLAAEIAPTLVRGRVLVGRCVPYGEGATFLPVLDLVRHAAAEATEESVACLLPDDEDGRLAAHHIAAIGGEAVPRGEAFWAVRVMLESLAADEPLIAVLDDVHWAEPVLLDLVEYLVERVEAPVVLLCLARPELLDDRPGWGGPASSVAVVHVTPLAAEESQALLDGLGGEGLDRRTRRRLVERAEGNPLHLQQLLALVAEEGKDAIEAVPPSIEAVLASRIDRLGPDARATLQRAAVAGRELTRGIVVALSDAGVSVDASLLELTRRGLVHPERSSGSDDAYRFHHVLLRDVAYASLPKALRADLHERAAAWLDRDGPGPDELVGWHLEQAHRYRSELRPDDPELPRLAEAAGERLGAAGIRAAKSSDPSVTRLLQRATNLLPDGKRRTELLLELGPWMRTGGDTIGSRQILREALRIAEARADDSGAARAEIDLAWAASAMETRRSMSSFRDVVEARLPVLDAAGDIRGLQRAWQLLSSAYLYDLQMEPMANAARQAASFAEAAGWPLRQAVMVLCSALVHGPTAVPSAIDEAEVLLARHAEDRDIWSVVAPRYASLTAMADKDEDIASMMAEARAITEELDDQLVLLTVWTPQRLEQLRISGDADAVRTLLTDWIAELREADNDAFLSTALVGLADLVVDGDPPRALALLQEAAARASKDDRLVQALIRSISAKHSAITGDLKDAMRLASDAVSILAHTDAICDRARIAIDQARVAELCGDETAAADALGEAHHLFTVKGNLRALRSLEYQGTRALT